MWRLGYNPENWNAPPTRRSSRPSSAAATTTTPPNPSTGTTSPADPARSLYLTAKPAFFGSNPWPWVDPVGATKLYTLPARARFDNGNSKPAVKPASTR